MTVIDILRYIFYTPNNINPSILKYMILEYGSSVETYIEVYEYIKRNEFSLNPIIIKQIIEKGRSNSDDDSKVGTMKVGTGKAK